MTTGEWPKTWNFDDTPEQCDWCDDEAVTSWCVIAVQWLELGCEQHATQYA